MKTPTIPVIAAISLGIMNQCEAIKGQVEIHKWPPQPVTYQPTMAGMDHKFTHSTKALYKW